jgi:hypothetical protein
VKGLDADAVATKARLGNPVYFNPPTSQSDASLATMPMRPGLIPRLKPEGAVNPAPRAGLTMDENPSTGR